MKLFKYLLGLIVVSLFLSSNVFAQEEMEYEEWENEIARLTQKKIDLTQDLQDLRRSLRKHRCLQWIRSSQPRGAHPY